MCTLLTSRIQAPPVSLAALSIPVDLPAGEVAPQGKDLPKCTLLPSELSPRSPSPILMLFFPLFYLSVYMVIFLAALAVEETFCQCPADFL